MNKRLYKKPNLIEYGDIARITQKKDKDKEKKDKDKGSYSGSIQ